MLRLWASPSGCFDSVADVRFSRHHGQMRRSSIVKAALLSIGLALCGGPVGAAPPPPSLVPVPNINSEEFQRHLAEEREAGRRTAERSNPVVTRSFVVGWELHGGFYLIAARDEWVTPDFASEDVLRQFGDFLEPGRLYPAGSAFPHEGERVVCECTGIEWSFYSQRRFIVQSARLRWVR